MTKRKVLLTEFSVKVFGDGRIDYDGLDRFLWELMHGGSIRELAIRSNAPKWRYFKGGSKCLRTSTP